MSVSFQASVRSGFGSGGYYVKLPYYFKEFHRILGDDPFPGTLNVAIDPSLIEPYYNHLETLDAIVIPAKIEYNQHHWKVICFPCKISIAADPKNAKLTSKCLALEFSNPDHKRGVVELVSTKQLRLLYNLKDGSPLLLNF